MTFWVICVILALVVGATVVAPLWRADHATAASPDVAFYRAQLDELDRDVARGVIDATEADQSRIEISRRLLAADRAAGPATTSTKAPQLAIICVALIGVTGLAGYAQLGASGYPDLPLKARLAASQEMRDTRPSQAAMAAAAPARAPVEAPEDYLANIAQLRLAVPSRGDELKGWELLAYHEAQLANYHAAADAQARVIDIKAAAATTSDRHRLLDLMVAATNGFVSPEAEAIARGLLATDPDDHVGRFYIGALFDQTDRPDVAVRMWQTIVTDGDPTAFHTAAARSQIENAALRAGVKYTLPATRGPSPEDIANAEDLSPEDRTAMITSMVAGLASRLAGEGGPATDWARLISAYGVLGNRQAATEVWLEAREVFAASSSAMDTLRTAAANAGITP
ncbi:MAG: c-type cytochrome biogenesis protein CcmI [Yoonia sp.]